MAGRSDVRVIVWTPLPLMSKSMVAGPASASASRIACLKDPAPLSAVLVTVKSPLKDTLG